MLSEILFSDLPSQARLDWISPAFPNAAQYCLQRYVTVGGRGDVLADR